MIIPTQAETPVQSADSHEWASKVYDRPRSGILQFRDKLWLLHGYHVRLRRLWCAALREVRSCWRNIEILRTTSLYRRGLFDQVENLPSEEQCFACIRDIQTIEAKYPHLSRVERQIIVEAWLLAEKRFLGNAGCYTEQHNLVAS